ncbi:hypothetical protein BHE74_00052885 [Ensete ventricosum]|nr:hypothetical protein BHE74_00052885 [Ensete ventricosum]
MNNLFSFILSAYYRGAMGILLVYDVTDESSFNSNNILYVLTVVLPFHFLAVPTSKGQALADEYGIKFFETVCGFVGFYPVSTLLVFNNVFDMLQSAKTNLNVEQVFFSIARDIKQRLAETDSKPEIKPVVWLQDRTIKINKPDQTAADGTAGPTSSCCGS